MKKILIALTFCLFTTTVTSYAGIYRNQPNNENVNSGSRGGALYGNTTQPAIAPENSHHASLFRSTTLEDPMDRPDIGGGIGVDAPVGDGFILLIILSLIFISIKYFKKSKKKTGSGTLIHYTVSGRTKSGSSVKKMDSQLNFLAAFEYVN